MADDAAELRDAEARRLVREQADAARRRETVAAAALQAKQDAAAAAAAMRRRLQEDVTRHERALADAQRLLQEADDADAAAAGGGDAPAGDDAADPDVTSVSALHAQALGILNVRALVPTVLDLATPSFSKWRRLLLLALGKYALADHVS